MGTFIDDSNPELGPEATVIEVPAQEAAPDPNAERAFQNQIPTPASGTILSALDQLTKLTMGGFYVLIAIVCGLMLAAGAWVSSIFAEKTATYQNLVEKVNQNNHEISNLKEELKDLNTVLGVKKTTEITIPDSVNIKKGFSIEGE